MRVPETELVAEREAPEISAGYATGQSCSHPISEETRWLRFWSSMWIEFVQLAGTMVHLSPVGRGRFAQQIGWGPLLWRETV